MSASQRHNRLVDVAAAYVIRLSGASVLLAILGVFVGIASVALPLLQRDQFERRWDAQPGPNLRALFLDDWGEWGVALTEDGSWVSFAGDTDPLSILAPEPPSPGLHVQRVFAGRGAAVVLWSDGTLTSEAVSFPGRRQAIVRRAGAPEPIVGRVVAARFVPDSNQTLWIAESETGRLNGGRSRVAVNFLGESSVDRHMFALTSPAGPVVAWALAADGNRIWGAAPEAIERWEIDDADADQAPVETWMATDTVALGLLAGETSLVSSHRDGTATIWFPIDDARTASKRTVAIHRLPAERAPLQDILAAPTTRSFVGLATDGSLQLAHATRGTRLATVDAGAAHIALNSRGDTLAAIDARGRVTVYHIDSRHPEASWTTLFGRIWYEGYNAPAWIWQSSAATDDSEPKFSLVPLIVGTLKATLFALAYSVPLALLAALYANQFLDRRAHRVVKPAIEMMASFPSVIVGFLAALWFAPLLQSRFLGFLLCLLFVPGSLAVFAAAWGYAITRTPRRRRPRGIEVILAIPVVAAGATAAFVVAPYLEAAIFGGDFLGWLYGRYGIQYEQRNALVVATALGFTVIPIIFTIADDALSNVPPSLSAASLALGASRWQTVRHVILPSASPGLFAAIMVGFGRAIGETMIVLMASGNTPLVDFSWYNGMRTLSANIAVEIPEAPVGGTHYRILYASALLLFLVTFVVNTVAETVRHRLRKRYGQF